MTDTYDLDRFIQAQDGVYEQALRELAAGRKQTHWMWFIFPHVAGLGSSDMAQRYAISGVDEAQAYLRHPALGQRLRTCTTAVNAVTGRSAHEIFGTPDDVKFRSSMTLFRRAGPTHLEFSTALAAYFGGKGDPQTLENLG